MQPTDLIVLSPLGSVDASVAGCRAGARGTLDLEFASDLNAAREGITRLARFAVDGWGVKVGAGSVGLLAGWDDTLRPSWVVLPADLPELAGHVRRLRYARVEVFVEAVSLAEAVAAEALGPDGLILKGHEAGGRVGPDPAFILVQKWRKHADAEGEPRLPFWVRGGIGPNTAAASAAAGAAGVVLDSQLLTCRESPASDELRKRVAGSDGSETSVLGERLGAAYRFYSRADSPAFAELAAEEDRLLAADLSAAEKRSAWRAAVAATVADDPTRGAWPVGQDFALGVGLAAKVLTVAGVVQAVAERSTKQVEAAARLKPLSEGGPLAKSHGTTFPILQGPMTRVSDTSAFADAVAAGGALPFLALALFRKAEAEKLLAETKAKVGGKPWGVGILGFVSPEIRAEQLAAVKRFQPPFAIIAGGRPDQAKELEADGIATYLHVPSPGLLRMFLKDGARRFIFEGRECGGHVGPRSSFALWEAMAEVLTEHAAAGKADDVHAVFAGGVHDALSAAMVSALAAGLAEKGVKVGVLLGTAYLFTEQAVAAGAITARFQREALGCGDTALLETGPGHAIRVIPTPYAADFEAEKRRLKADGKSPLEVGIALERMNLGRLRVASKGVDRAPVGGNGSHLAAVPEAEQHRRGMYMIGQVAALRDSVTTIPQLHADVSAGSARVLDALSPLHPFTPSPAHPPQEPPCDVAIIGVACFYPKATGARHYWENVLAKTPAVEEIPATHWDWRPYYDPDPRARDKMVSKWGGFMGDTLFDPLTFGITPKSIPNIEPLQLLLLEGVRQAVADAGYADRPFARERTAAVVGIGGGGMPLSVAYGFRACMPLLESLPNVAINSDHVIACGDGILPEWTEDSFPGILLNVAAGRVANRFNLGGPNMAIDAACGSSLAAVYAGVRELTAGTSDVAIVMGADTVQTPYAYVAFSKTHALSPKGRCRPFDAAADGIALAEGIGVAILKRLSDAERDGDRVYAVIRGMGASSDGRDKGLTAPRAEGQLRALRRAYGQARISPARVGLVEAHGTGTVVGDQTEALALGQMFREAGGDPQSCALGSVKSMIGHSKCAAGLAGLIKTAYALHHKVLPPTLAETPNPKANLDGGPLYLNTEPRPWVHGGEHPRAAGVSAFGFGGTNFHAVLEEHTGDYLPNREAGIRRWPAELFVWRRPDRAALLAAVRHCRDALAAGAEPTLADLAASVWQSSRGGVGQPTLAVVAGSLAELTDRLDTALSILPTADAHTDPRGVYFADKPGSIFHSAIRHPQSAIPRVAFLFPGQGSQYPDMLAQLGMAFAEVREVLDAADRALAGKLDRPLGRFIYPPSPFTPEQEAANRKNLQRTEVAQPAVGACDLAMARLLAALGVEPDLLAGHSYGEYAALAAAGALTADDLARLSHRRGEVIRDAAAAAGGGMVAADADLPTVERALAGVADVWPANQNSPQQTVVAGTDKGLTAAVEKLKASGVRGQRIPVACGFHSPLIAGAKQPLAAALAAARFAAPRKPVYSNTTAAPHDPDPAAVRARLADHLVAPVRFAAELEAMYAAGARVFVEVGPNAVLTGLASQTLAGKPHLAVASDSKSRPGLVQLAHLLGQLLAAGVPARLDRLFSRRGLQPFDAARMTADTGKLKPSPTAWLVNGVRSRPVNGPEPRLLGQPRAKTDAPAALPAKKPAPPASPPVPAPAPVAAQAKPVTPVSRVPIPPAVPVAPRATMSTPTPSTNGHHHAPAAAPPTEAAAAVMLRFQDVMAKFLDTQKSVMLGYLGAGGTTPLPAPAVNGYAVLPNGNGHHHGNGHPVPPVIASRLAEPPPVARPAPPAPAVNGNGHHPAPAAVIKPAAPVEPKTVAAPVETKPAALDRDALLAKLLDLVSDRTGYPKEALSIDLDLEADLGVDSIKRVEILGSLAETIEAGAGDTRPSLEMEKLSAIKTLRGIADYVLDALTAASAPTPAAVPTPAAPLANGSHRQPAGDLHPGARRGDVQRLVVNLIDAPLPARPTFSPLAGAILLTDDGRGTAQELADHLADLDVKTVLLRHGPDADLSDPAAVAELLAKVRADAGPVAGLIHLLPLAEPPAGESDERRLRREVKSLYLLARNLEPDLRAAGRDGSAVLLAVTGMGGRMGFDGDLPAGFFAGHGGVAGFTKCLGHEWPDVTVRCVDVDPETPATALAEALLGELADPAGPFEVGVSSDGRVTWQCDPGPVDADDGPALDLGPDATVLLTGGARGITAKVAEELARRHRCRLVLAGSSPPPADEPSDVSGLSSPADIKAALLKRVAGGPAAVEAAYQRLKKDREIRGNLAAVAAAGGKPEYRQVNVADPAAFGALVDELQAAGGIDAVFHGAGVIEDKLLKDKTPESFDRVFGTKVDSALTLARKLDPGRTKFVALFASITSRYGNRGQSDYAAANEVLSKLAHQLDREWPGRVVSMAWGPWGGVGMVADLEKHLTARGLQLIDPAVGAGFAADELRFGRKGTAEVVIAGGTEQAARPAKPRPAAEPAGV